MAKIKVDITDKDTLNRIVDKKQTRMQLWTKTREGYRELFRTFIDVITKDVYTDDNKSNRFDNILNFGSGHFEGESVKNINQKYEEYIMTPRGKRCVEKYYSQLIRFFPESMLGAVLKTYRDSLGDDTRIVKLMSEFWKFIEARDEVPDIQILLSYDFDNYMIDDKSNNKYDLLRMLSVKYDFEVEKLSGLWNEYKGSKSPTINNSKQQTIDKFLTIINIISFVLSSKLSDERSSIWMDQYVDLESMNILSDKKDKNRIKTVPAPVWLEELCNFGIEFIFSIFATLSTKEKYEFLMPFNKMLEGLLDYSDFVEYYTQWPVDLQIIFFDNLTYESLLEHRLSTDEESEDIVISYKKTQVFDYSKFPKVHRSKLASINKIVTDWLVNKYTFYYEKTIDFNNFDPEVIHFWDDDRYTEDIKEFLDSKIGSKAKFPEVTSRNSTIQEINTAFIYRVIDNLKSIIKHNVDKYSMENVLSGVRDNNIKNAHLLYRVQDGILEILKDEVKVYKLVDDKVDNRAKFNLRSNFNFNLNPTKAQYRKDLKYKDFDLNLFLKSPESYLNESESKKYLIAKKRIDDYLNGITQNTPNHKSLLLGMISPLLRPITQDRKMRIIYDDGIGGNGKTTFLNFVNTFLGDNSIAFANFMQIFSKKSSDKYVKSLWVGKTGVFFDEIPDDFREVDIESFKESLNEVNQATIEQKYKNPTLKELNLTFSGNKNGKFIIRNQSFPTLDRFILIPWAGYRGKKISVKELLSHLFEYRDYARMYIFKLIIELEQENLKLQEQNKNPRGWELIERGTLELYETTSKYNQFMFGDSRIRIDNFPYYANFWNINLQEHFIEDGKSSFFSGKGSLQIIKTTCNFVNATELYLDFVTFIESLDGTDRESVDFRFKYEYFKSKMENGFGLKIVNYDGKDYLFDSDWIRRFTISEKTNVYSKINKQVWDSLVQYFKKTVFKPLTDSEQERLRLIYPDFDKFTLDEYLKTIKPINKPNEVFENQESTKVETQVEEVKYEEIDDLLE